MTPNDPKPREQPQRPEETSAASAGATSSGNATLEERVIAAMRTIYDPEIPVNIYDLGLVYELTVDGEGTANVRMTLTAPGCPVAQSFPAMVEEALRAVPGVSDAHVELVWDPPWSRERMSEAARLELGML